MNVGIIGAGISGIAAAKEFIKKNYNIKIFEKNSDIGGVWLTKSYPMCRVQSTKKSYCFSDIEFSEEVNEYPYREEVIDYLNKVCEIYSIKKYINFNCEVTGCSFDYNLKKWKITYNKNLNYICDYLIISSGFYTKNKNYENIVTKDLIGTKVFYPQDFSFNGTLEPKKFKDKNIVVIGNGPSGCDMAVMARKNGAKNVTVFYRNARWICKRYIWDSISSEFIINKNTEYISSKLPKSLRIIIATVFYYIVFILLHFNFTSFDMPKEHFNRNNIVLNENFVKMVYKKDINYVKSKETYIDENKIITKNNEFEYDICILSTGYENDIKVMNFDLVPKMYKHIIHPEYQNCAFIGFAASFNWPLVSEKQSKWYINFIEKKLSQKLDISCQLETNENKNFYDYHDVGGGFGYIKELEENLDKY